MRKRSAWMLRAADSTTALVLVCLVPSWAVLWVGSVRKGGQLLMHFSCSRDAAPHWAHRRALLTHRRPLRHAVARRRCAHCIPPLAFFGSSQRALAAQYLAARHLRSLPACRLPEETVLFGVAQGYLQLFNVVSSFLFLEFSNHGATASSKHLK